MRSRISSQGTALHVNSWYVYIDIHFHVDGNVQFIEIHFLRFDLGLQTSYLVDWNAVMVKS